MEEEFDPGMVRMYEAPPPETLVYPDDYEVPPYRDLVQCAAELPQTYYERPPDDRMILEDSPPTGGTVEVYRPDAGTSRLGQQVESRYPSQRSAPRRLPRADGYPPKGGNYRPRDESPESVIPDSEYSWAGSVSRRSVTSSRLPRTPFLVVPVGNHVCSPCPVHTCWCECHLVDCEEHGLVCVMTSIDPNQCMVHGQKKDTGSVRARRLRRTPIETGVHFNRQGAPGSQGGVRKLHGGAKGQGFPMPEYQPPGKSLWHGPLDLEKFNSHDEINNYLRWVAESFPFCGLVNIGKTLGGRDMLVLQVGENRPGQNQRKAIWLDAGIQGKEWIAPATALYVIYRLVSGLSNHVAPIIDMIKDYNFLICPVANPDGYERARVRTLPGLNTYSGNTVDNWKGPRDLSDAHSDVHPDTLIEPCVQNIREFIFRYRSLIMAYIALHSFGQPNNTIFPLPGSLKENLSSRCDRVSYKVTDAWAKGVAAIRYSYAVELRESMESNGQTPSGWHLTPTGEEVFEALKSLLPDIYAREMMTDRRAIEPAQPVRHRPAPHVQNAITAPPAPPPPAPPAPPAPRPPPVVQPSPQQGPPSIVIEHPQQGVVQSQRLTEEGASTIPKAQVTSNQPPVQKTVYASISGGRRTQGVTQGGGHAVYSENPMPNAPVSPPQPPIQTAVYGSIRGGSMSQSVGRGRENVVNGENAAVSRTQPPKQNDIYASVSRGVPAAGRNLPQPSSQRVAGHNAGFTGTNMVNNNGLPMSLRSLPAQLENQEAQMKLLARDTWPRNSSGQPIPPGAQKDFNLEMEARRLEAKRLSRIREEQQHLREEETIYSQNDVVSSGSEAGEMRTESEVERAFGLYAKHGQINITSTQNPDELEVNML